MPPLREWTALFRERNWAGAEPPPLGCPAPLEIISLCSKVLGVSDLVASYHVLFELCHLLRLEDRMSNHVPAPLLWVLGDGNPEVIRV